MFETISVIIPAKSDSKDLKILKYIERIEYPKDKIEIILAVGKHPSAQRNEAVKIAKGDILYFFNSDTQIEPDMFKRAVEIINGDIRIAGAGGPDLTPPDNNYIQHLFGYAMGSYFAHWKMRARYSWIGAQRISDEKELLLSNMAIRKDIFLKSGLFNEKLYPNEENELINRINGMGYKFIYSPELKIYRDRRKTLPAFIKQFYRYGRGRMDQIFIEGLYKNIWFFLPFFSIIYVLALPAIKNHWVSFLPLFAYLILGVADSAFLSFKNKKNLILFLPIIYMIMHLSYSAGMVSSLFKNILRKNKNVKSMRDTKIIFIKDLTAKSI